MSKGYYKRKFQPTIALRARLKDGLVFVRSEVSRNVAFRLVRAAMSAEDRLLVIDAGDRVNIAWDAARMTAKCLRKSFVGNTKFIDSGL